ncbi:MAG TPA: hypothetical protein QF753_12065 [Victivallales bacterium]|nr:hypothetical protein [Victivallales bacterium]
MMNLQYGNQGTIKLSQSFLIKISIEKRRLEKQLLEMKNEYNRISKVYKT